MASQGETSLLALLKSMNPSILPPNEEYVFAKLPTNTPTETLASLLPSTKMLFLEEEEQAWTVILPKSVADKQGATYAFPCRQITLNVHSSLDAVGFLAVVTTRLAERLKVGVNPVSGYYHDHLFVAVGKEDEVLAELKKMAAEQQ